MESATKSPFLNVTTSRLLPSLNSHFLKLKGCLGNGGTSPGQRVAVTGSGVKKFTNCTYMLSVKGDYEKAAAALSHSLYWAPYYKDEDGREVGTTELILVQLHPGTTLEQMKRLAKEYSVEMIGAAKYSPKFYLFACTNRSKGNALEMSAVFYESGLFEVVEPDEIITGHF